ncbi:MAG TPA: glycoside hydrolase family 38 C-terminal domain-containing protein [Bacilli bacterium]
MKNIENKLNKMYVISHTHWDREWYQDFQTYRNRLVGLIDELLDHMETDPNYKYFMMDGQTIVIDDYLEIRPENRERLLGLIQQGRVKVGPWYVMPDEFLVSGESLIRNLLKGCRSSRAWGVEPMKSGYVTDVFGHNSQFPQILKGFGIDNAVLFRGFYGDGDDSEIWWDAADGSRVLGLKLDEDRSYGDFYFFLRWPFVDRNFNYEREELIERAKAMIDYKSKRATTNIIMGLDGVDHIEIEPQLPWMLKTLNEAGLEVEFIHTHLEHYLGDLRSKVGELQVYQGEQRSPGFNGLNNWVLANVLSSRIHLKQKNHHCETLLEKWAEPWGVFASLEGRSYPKQYLSKAWEFLIQNHPHDSICGCSIDQVHQDMIYRFDQSRLISELMIGEQLVYISNHLDLSQHEGNHVITVFNPVQSEINGVIEVEFALPAMSDAAVTMFQYGGTSFRIYDAMGNEIPYQLMEVRKNSSQMWRPYRDIPHERKVDRYAIALHAQVPAFGYVSFIMRKLDMIEVGDGEYSRTRMSTPVRYPGSMQVNTHTWDNGRIRVQAQRNGTIDFEDLKTGMKFQGLLLLEDEADIGEGWNHVSPVTNEVFNSFGANADISVVYDGPLQTRIRIRNSISVPNAIQAGETRRGESFIDLLVTTYLDIRKEDPVIRCHTVINNNARDHRLRLLFPSGLNADHYHTSTPFDLVERNIMPPDYSKYMEKDRNVVPHNGIITVDDGSNGLAIYSKGLYEAIVRSDEPRTIAMTLYRSTGKEVLSDGGDGGQLLNQLEFHYAIRSFVVDEEHPKVLWNEHQQFAAGIRTVDREMGQVLYETMQRREADLPLDHSFLQVSHSGLVVSAVKASEDRKGSYIIRLLNVTADEIQGTLAFDRPVLSARLVNLDEQFINDLNIRHNEVDIIAKSKQIITIEVIL